jgi:hypothetical protein
MTRTRCIALVLALPIAGCGGPAADTDAGTAPGEDGGGGQDAGSTPDTGAPVDAAMPSDTGTSPTCGTAMPSLTGTSGTEGLVIARDGTIYYSRSNGVGRIGTDGTNDATWLSIPGSATIWGLALDATNTHLFIGDPTAGQLRVATGLDATPSQTPLAAIDQPNGVTVGPDGAVYVSDFGNDSVLRVDASSGAMTTVTASAIAGADGVAFTDDGHLLVTSYADGTVVSLTLDASHHETARATVATSVPSADGVALDEAGTIYVGGGSRVYRIGAGGTPDMTLQMGHTGTANIEWGAGVLGCHDLYVATGGGLTRIALTVGQRAVPWH